eukprot:scaffold84113_cov63-Phaeocystis_antarctica.AAC.3
MRARPREPRCPRAWLALQRGWVADDDEADARAGEGDVDASRVGEEAECSARAADVVGTHAAEDDDLLLAPLKAVDRRDLELLSLRLAAAAQHAAQQAHLRRVGRDDADLGGADAAAPQPADHLGHGLRLGGVGLGGAVGCLAAAVHRHERDGQLRHRPVEACRGGPVGGGDAGAQPSAVN